MKTPNEKDIALTIVPETAQPWDKQVERRLIRKIDLILLPIMFTGYSLVYYDKAILGGAAVFGMSTDLHLRVIVDPTTVPPRASTQRLSWATSLFYFGMLAGLFPLTYLFQRFHAGRTIGSVVILWGAVAMSTAGVTTYKGLYAQRFFLGFTESIVPTAFMVIVSGYYTQAEQTWRQCLWYSSTGGMTVLGSLINYGFAHIPKTAPLRPWQYLYLTAGAVTVLFGVVLLFLPNSPADAWFLSKEERVVAVERLRGGQMGVRCQKIKGYQVLEGVKDVKVWLITVCMGIAYTINGAISGFGPLIVSTFGWTAYDALLLQIPLGALCFITILLVGFISLKIPNVRLIMLATCCLPVIAGSLMIWKSTWSHRAATPIAGYTILGTFAPVTSLIVSTSMVNVAGASKKSYTASMVFVFYCVGNIVGPQLIVTQTVGRHYPRLWTGIVVCYCLLVAVCAGLWWLYRGENLRREERTRGVVGGEAEREKVGFDDLTDGENVWFRYAY